MSHFDEEIGLAVRRGAGSIRPARDLSDRVVAGVVHRNRQARVRRGLAGTMAAILALFLALPGPRAFATDVAKYVFKINGVTYEFVEPEPREPVPDSEPRKAHMIYAPAIDTVYSAVGEFPAEAVAAIANLGDPYRIPDWVPPELPVTVAVPIPLVRDPDDAAAGMPEPPQLPLLYRFGDPDDRWQQIVVEQRMLPDGDISRTYVHDPGDDAVITKMNIGDVEVLESIIADRVLYTFHIDRMQIDVAGPLAERELMYRLTEALIR